MSRIWECEVNLGHVKMYVLIQGMECPFMIRLFTALYFFVFFFSINERAVRTTRKLDASAKRKKQGGGGRGAKKYFSFARFPPPPSARLRFALASFALLR